MEIKKNERIQMKTKIDRQTQSKLDINKINKKQNYINTKTKKKKNECL